MSIRDLKYSDDVVNARGHVNKLKCVATCLVVNYFMDCA